MNHVDSTAANSGAPKIVNVRSVVRNFLAVAIVFIMVASAFFTVVANARADGPPTIWTSKPEYVPGEQVIVYGTGFSSGPITLNFSHSDWGVQSFDWSVGYNGEFTYPDYTAGWVTNATEPVVVGAYQNGVLIASTTFLDPEVTVLAWSLDPNTVWQKGDIKGYFEDDTIPFEVTISNQGVGSDVTVTLGFDFVDPGPPIVLGIDYLTQYNLDPPLPPFNTYANSSAPFTVDPTVGTITHQDRVLPNVLESGEIIQVWTFTLHFTSSKDALVKFGAHLALTKLPNILGASYYPGSSLHVDIISTVPSFDKGNRDVPIPTNRKQILTPPHIELTKECSKENVVKGDTITFTICASNTGEGDATSVVLDDSLPLQLDYTAGSTKISTTAHPIYVAFSDPDMSKGTNHLEWNLPDIPGT